VPSSNMVFEYEGSSASVVTWEGDTIPGAEQVIREYFLAHKTEEDISMQAEAHLAIKIQPLHIHVRGDTHGMDMWVIDQARNPTALNASFDEEDVFKMTNADHEAESILDSEQSPNA